MPGPQIEPPLMERPGFGKGVASREEGLFERPVAAFGFGGGVGRGLTPNGRGRHRGRIDATDLETPAVEQHEFPAVAVRAVAVDPAAPRGDIRGQGHAAFAHGHMRARRDPREG